MTLAATSRGVAVADFRLACRDLKIELSSNLPIEVPISGIGTLSLQEIRFFPGQKRHFLIRLGWES